MKIYTLKLELLSPTLIGSGQGWGATVDTDIVFDDMGIPFIPAKRVKGCLRDAVNEIEHMFSLSGNKSEFKKNFNISEIFGESGNEKPASVYFSNLFIEDYKKNKTWLTYLREQHKAVVSRERIAETFTEIRQQTAIDSSTGTARDSSLRTGRVARKGLIFRGEIQIFQDKVHSEKESSKIAGTLALACLNFRRFGTQRNRGFGDVCCTLRDDENTISVEKKLEALCTD